MPEQRLDFRDPDWVAKQLGIDKNAVYRYLDEGVLPGLRLGRKWLISESTLVEQLKREEEEQTRNRRWFASVKADFQAAEFMERVADIPFTDRGRRALEAAREESIAWRHNYIGQEHLMLAFDRDPGCTAQRILDSVGVRSRSELDSNMRPGDAAPSDKRGLTPRAHKAVRLAIDEARTRGDRSVGTEHLLLGISREGEGIGAGMLHLHGVGVEQIDAELARIQSADAD